LGHPAVGEILPAEEVAACLVPHVVVVIAALRTAAVARAVETLEEVVVFPCTGLKEPSSVTSVKEPAWDLPGS
jgi:C4-dicarboxylate transporter